MSRVEAVAKIFYEHDLKDFGATPDAPTWENLRPQDRKKHFKDAERFVAAHDALKPNTRTNQVRKAK